MSTKTFRIKWSEHIAVATGLCAMAYLAYEIMLTVLPSYLIAGLDHSSDVRMWLVCGAVGSSLLLGGIGVAAVTSTRLLIALRKREVEGLRGAALEHLTSTGLIFFGVALLAVATYFLSAVPEP